MNFHFSNIMPKRKRIISDDPDIVTARRRITVERLRGSIFYLDHNEELRKKAIDTMLSYKDGYIFKNSTLYEIFRANLITVFKFRFLYADNMNHIPQSRIDQFCST